MGSIFSDDKRAKSTLVQSNVQEYLHGHLKHGRPAGGEDMAQFCHFLYWLWSLALACELLNIRDLIGRAETNPCDVVPRSSSPTIYTGRILDLQSCVEHARCNAWADSKFMDLPFLILFRHILLSRLCMSCARVSAPNSDLRACFYLRHFLYGRRARIKGVRDCDRRCQT